MVEGGNRFKKTHFLIELSIFISNSMSRHRSLRGSSNLAAKRNVLKRLERIELMKKRGKWKPGDRVLGLAKTKPDA